MPSLTVEANIDSEMNPTDANGNFGDLELILMGLQFAGGEKLNLWRPIANFDVSALIGRQINDAKLVRHIVAVDGEQPWTATVYRCKRAEQWVELEVSWFEYAAGMAWDAPGAGGAGDVDTVTPAPVTFTEASGPGDHEILGMKGFVEDALAFRNGLVSIRPQIDAEDFDGARQTSWYSKDKGSNVWRLVIDYSPASPGRRSPRDGARRSPLARGASAAQPARPTRPAHPIQPRHATMRSER